MTQLNRRRFNFALAAGSSFLITGTKASGNIIGANDRVRIAVAGVNGRRFRPGPMREEKFDLRLRQQEPMLFRGGNRHEADAERERQEARGKAPHRTSSSSVRYCGSPPAVPVSDKVISHLPGMWNKNPRA